MSSDPINLGLLFLLVLSLLFLLVRFLFRTSEPKLKPQDRFPRRVIPVCEAITDPELPHGWKAVFPHAGETFFERAEHPNPIYEIEIEGTCQYYRSRYSTVSADATYYEKDGRYTEKHFALFINNDDLSHWRCRSDAVEVVAEDRGKHSYLFRFEGAQVALAFGEACKEKVAASNGFLRARVTALPEGTPGYWEREEQERKRRKERRAAVEHATEFAHTVKELAILAQLYRNWGDPIYRDKFARAHTAELIGQQAGIRREAAALLAEDRIMTFFGKHNPAALEVLLGRLDGLFRAERVSVDKALARAEAPNEPPQALLPASPQATPARELTASEVTEAKVRQQRIELGYRLALAKDLVATKEALRGWVRIEYADLDEDEQQRITQEILDTITREDDHGKTL